MTRILIVDDMEQNRYLLEALLKGNGFDVTSTKNGAEALEDAVRNPPDLVVADILMPVMDGFELCRRWKAHEFLRNVPFIFYTGTYVNLKDEQFARSLGADRFMVKPERPGIIVQAIRDVLKEAHQGQDPITGLPENENKILREYNEVLFHKLEKKLVDLEADIAKRTLTERALSESEERFRKIFENGSIGMALVGLDFRFIKVNNEFSRMLGYSRDEMDHLGWPEISHPDDRHMDVEGMLRLKSEDIPLYNTVNRFIRKDDSIIWARTGVSAFRDQKDRFYFFIVLVIDITEEMVMKERERQALLQIEDNLEQLAALNDQIRNPLAIIVAQAMLENNMRSKDQILLAVKSIDDIVTELDERWAESAKVRDFLQRHNQISKRS